MGWWSDACHSIVVIVLFFEGPIRVLVSLGLSKSLRGKASKMGSKRPLKQT